MQYLRQVQKHYLEILLQYLSYAIVYYRPIILCVFYGNQLYLTSSETTKCIMVYRSHSLTMIFAVKLW